MVRRLAWWKSQIAPRVSLPNTIRLKIYELQLFAQLVMNTYEDGNFENSFPYPLNLSATSRARQWAIDQKND